MLEYGWRLIATALSYLVYGVGSGLLWYVIYPLTAWCFPSEARCDYARFLSQRAFGLLIWFMSLAGVWRYQVAGLERLKKPGRVIIANHPSFLDVVLLFAWADKAVCVVKPNLTAIPLVGKPIRCCGHVVTEDPEQLVGKGVGLLQGGASLILFPQGTRTDPTLPVRFHRSAARIALEAGVPLVPVYFQYRPLILGKGQQWYNVPPRRPQVRVLVGEEILPETTGFDQPLSLASRQLTRRLEGLFKDWERRYGHIGK